jgi:hypothetical protein
MFFISAVVGVLTNNSILNSIVPLRAPCVRCFGLRGSKKVSAAKQL